jgi:beta-lactamase regulating signal transducer with metallopeptidase domain
VSALVGGIIWSCLAGTAVAALLTGIVATVIKLQRPAAATRCALWFVALATCLVAPLAIAGTMALRSEASARSAQSGIVRFIRPPLVRVDGVLHGNVASDAASHPRLRALESAARALLTQPALSTTAAKAVLTIWAAGAIVGFAGVTLGLWRVHRLKARSTPLDGSLAGDLPWLTESGGREIYLRLSYEIETPVAVGFGRPVILIPTDMATAAGLGAIEPLVMHEYAHLRRYDDWTNLAQRAIERIVWFDPLVWFIGHRLALEREVAADEAVVERTDDPKEYAATLWRMVREMRMPERIVVAPGAMLTRKQISVRIERLLQASRARRPSAGGALTLLAVVAVAVFAVGEIAAAAPPFACPSIIGPASVADGVRSAVAALLPTHRARDGGRAGDRTDDRAGDRDRAGVHDGALDVARVLNAVMPSLAASASREGVRRRGIAGCTGCNLQGADLHGQDLHDAQLTGANMQHADLHDADLRGADITGANLQGANLNGADLRDARLVGTNLQHASMDRALLAGARFIGTTLP